MKISLFTQLVLITALVLTSCGHNESARSSDDAEIDAIVSEVQSPSGLGYEPVDVGAPPAEESVSTDAQANTLRQKLQALRQKLGGRFGRVLAALRAFRQRRQQACQTESESAQACTKARTELLRRVRSHLSNAQ